MKKVKLREILKRRKEEKKKDEPIANYSTISRRRTRKSR